MTAIILNAEDMTLDSGYVVKDRLFADGNQLIHLTELTGKAVHTFAGDTGTYDVALTHYDELDGEATIKVTIGNHDPIFLTLDQILTGSRPSANNQTETSLFQGLEINSGDTIEIMASMDGGEVAAIDFITLTPVVVNVDTTPPAATLTANDFNVDLDSSNAYEFDVTFTDNEAIDISSLTEAITVTDSNGTPQTISVQVDSNTNAPSVIATYSFNPPGGTWDESEEDTYTVSVANTVIDTSNNAVTAGDLGTFNVNVLSQPLTQFRVEAEDMILGGDYEIEDSYDTNIVSNGAVIAVGFTGQGDETGTADYTFTGESGSYNVVVTYFDESDGKGNLTVKQNDTTLDSWIFDLDSTQNRVGENNRVQRPVAQDITIQTGDVFSLEGQREGGESTRVDYIEFIPVEDTVTNPAPDINPPTISYRLSTQPILARLDQEFAIKLDYEDTIKIMPLGDSITAGKENNQQQEADWEGYRRFLYDSLTEIGLDFDFVGSQVNGLNDEFDRENEGHRGWTINQIAFGRDNGNNGGVDRWIPDADPDVVILKIGTNGTGANSDDQLDNNLIPKIFENLSEDSKLIVSTIAPVHPDINNFEDRTDTINEYNAAISGIVDKYDAFGENISFVDIQAGPNGIQPEDMSNLQVDNGLHPTAAGYQKIANFYYQAVLDAVGTTDTFDNIGNIIGSDFGDVIVGNDSDNEILGGEGDDELTGGSGADVFVYETINDADIEGDTLTDFNPAEGDIFQINSALFGGGLVAGTALSNGTEAATGVLVSNANPQPVGSSVNFLYNTGTGVLRVDLDGIGGGSAVELATLTNRPNLTTSQFEIV